jgi:hypothetical protein
MKSYLLDIGFVRIKRFQVWMISTLTFTYAYGMHIVSMFCTIIYSIRWKDVEFKDQKSLLDFHLSSLGRSVSCFFVLQCMYIIERHSQLVVRKINQWQLTLDVVQLSMCLLCLFILCAQCHNVYTWWLTEFNYRWMH